MTQLLIKMLKIIKYFTINVFKALQMLKKSIKFRAVFLHLPLNLSL